MMQQRFTAGFKIKLVTCPETKTTLEHIRNQFCSLMSDHHQRYTRSSKTESNVLLRFKQVSGNWCGDGDMLKKRNLVWKRALQCFTEGIHFTQTLKNKSTSENFSYTIKHNQCCQSLAHHYSDHFPSQKVFPGTQLTKTWHGLMSVDGWYSHILIMCLLAECLHQEGTLACVCLQRGPGSSPMSFFYGYQIDPNSNEMKCNLMHLALKPEENCETQSWTFSSLLSSC